MKYNTKTIEFFLQQINEGNTVGQETPFFRGNTFLRKAYLPFEMSKEETDEYTKCSQDIIYFAEKYCKIQLKNGIIDNFKLYDFQKEYLNFLENQNRIVNMSSRQTGISYMHAIYLLKQMLFNVDKTYVCVGVFSKDFIKKVSMMYINLPFFLKSGIKTYNQKSICFDNGNKLITGTIAPIARNINEIIIEDFAHIPHKSIETYYKCLIPIMKAQINSKIVISSTPNGFNMFKEIWDGANTNDTTKYNGYKPFSVYWYQIPDHDEKWKQQTIKEIGLKAFEQEYELKFLTSTLNTEIVNDIIENETEPIIWLNNEIGVRKHGLIFEYTNEEKEIKEKVHNDVMYFAENYIHIKQENETISKLALRDYQKNSLKTMNNNNKIIMNVSRETGLTKLLAIHILHSLMEGKTILFVGNLYADAIELVNKVKDIYMNLPFFLKEGVKSWNQKQIVFENGGVLKTYTRSRQPALGFAVDEIIIKDFAHIPENIVKVFYNSVYPVFLSTKNSKIIITSTPNGDNLFKELWDKSNLNNKHIDYNGFTPILLPYDVVNNRDEKWKQKTIKEIGSIKAFEQEYELKFLTSTINTELSGNNKSLKERVEYLENIIEKMMEKYPN
jgi:hypothetical protein